MRSGGRYGAAAALSRARAADTLARRTGVPVDEAHGRAAGRSLSRRHFLQAAGALGAALPVLASVPAASATPARTPGDRRRAAAEGRVVVVGSGIAGLSCAERLWRRHGIPADVYEYNTVAGGRIRTLRDHFADGQLVEEHAEFINPEHRATLALARRFGLALDNMDRYPAGIDGDVNTLSFSGSPWSQAQLDADWHGWARKLFHQAAFVTAPWPQRYDHHNAGGLRFDRQSVTEWIDDNIPGGTASDFGALCISVALDEFGGPPEEQSALNLVYLLGEDDSTRTTAQPRRAPELDGADEKWHLRGGTDQLITGLAGRLPAGTLHLGEELVAVRPSGRGFLCTFDGDGTTTEVAADHVVLSLPFTRLRLVDLAGVDLSPLHRRAIDEEPLGDNAKFFVQCADRVWDDPDRLSGDAYCDGIVQGAWEASLHQPGRAGILAALPGGAVGEDWGATYGLTGYRGTPPDAMVAAYLAAFDQLFPGVERAYNGRSYYVWSTGDPHILGAYSYLKVGQYTGFNGIQGQREGNLHFAGEHTSMNFQGYIEGGLRSGYRCADEVAGRG